VDFIIANTDCQVRRRVVFPATCPASWTSKTQQVGYQMPITRASARPCYRLAGVTSSCAGCPYHFKCGALPSPL